MKIFFLSFFPQIVYRSGDLRCYSLKGGFKGWFFCLVFGRKLCLPCLTVSKLGLKLNWLGQGGKDETCMPLRYIGITYRRMYKSVRMDVAMILAFCWSLLLCTWRIIAEYSPFNCLYKELPVFLSRLNRSSSRRRRSPSRRRDSRSRWTWDWPIGLTILRSRQCNNCIMLGSNINFLNFHCTFVVRTSQYPSRF